MEIKEVISLDIYRDGGSLSVRFRDAVGVEHVLFFSILSADKKNGAYVRRYDSASIKSFKTVDWVNPVTGVCSEVEEMNEVPVSWEIATDILRGISRLIPQFESKDQWVFGDMVAVAKDLSHSITSTKVPG